MERMPPGSSGEVLLPAPDGRLAAGEAAFGYQPVIDPFGGVVLFPGFELGAGRICVGLSNAGKCWK